MCEYSGAERTFRRVRQVDETVVDCMDQYAQLLQRRGAIEELNRFAAEILDIDDKRPEAWVTLALYHETRNDNEKALGEFYNVVLLFTGSYRICWSSRCIRLCHSCIHYCGIWKLPHRFFSPFFLEPQHSLCR